MEGSYVVIKVKYGDMLRRFNVQVVDDEFDISIDALRKKITSLFSLLPDSELMLTYIDEDGDFVTLADDDDLRDVVKQELNPLRITVKLRDEKSDKQKKNSSGSSTPRARASSVNQQPPQNPDSLVREVIRNVPEPVLEMLVGLSADLASKVSSTSPAITEIVDLFAKVCSSNMGQLSVTQTEEHCATEAGVSEFNKASTKAKNLVDHDLTDAMSASLKMDSKEQHPVSMQSLEKLETEEDVDTNGAKLDNATGGNSEGSSSKAFNHSAVAAALESLDAEVSSWDSTLIYHPKSHLTSGFGRKGKTKRDMMRKIIEKHLSRKHHLAPNPPPHTKKHWGVEKPGECSLSSDKMAAGSHGINIEKEINKPDDGKLAPNPFNRSANPNPFQAPNIVDPNMPEFSSDPIAKNNSSFSDTSTRNVSAVPPRTAFEPFPLVRSTRLQDGTGAVIHLGVRCDGCGVYPITGPRFKSKVKVDYDLCDDCFEEIGNNTDYIRMDGPIVYPYQMSFKGLNDAIPHAKGRDPTLPKVYIGSKVKPTESKLDSRFVQDVNIVDGTVMAPSVPFTKIWQLRNNGTVAWPLKTQLVWVGGYKLSNALSVEVNVPEIGLMVDHELDVAVDLISPELPGRYISYWRLATPSGQKFGQRVWVLIEVDASLRIMQQGGDRGFNLNLPPSLTNPEITNINREMTMIEEMNKLEPNSSKKPLETVEPEVDSKQNFNHELKFPINDSLLVGSGASNLNPSSSTSFVSYPIIDLSDLTPPPPPPPPSVPRGVTRVTLPPPLPPRYSASQGNEYNAPPPPPPPVPKGATRLTPPPRYAASRGNKYYVPPPPPPVREVAARVNSEVEEDLLRKLKEMGFNLVDLNKEVLRLSGYDLVQAVDILSGFP